MMSVAGVMACVALIIVADVGKGHCPSFEGRLCWPSPQKLRPVTS